MKKQEFKAKTYFSYSEYIDESTEESGENITAVTGDLSIKPTAAGALINQMCRINDSTISLINNNYTATGCSKCLEEDTFDQKFGLVLAGRKAEAKCYKKALDQVCELKVQLQEMLNTVLDMEDKLDYKAGKCALDTVALKRTGKTLQQIKGK